MKLHTPRLELMAATLEMVTADLHRRAELAKLLKVQIPAGWPPPLMDVAAMQRLKESLLADPAPGGWTTWYWVLRKGRLLAGISGFKGRPRNGAVEIGYSLVPQLHRHGLATEAVGAMTAWAFAQGVEMIFAETLPELIASQRVLLKNGFQRAGEGSEPGVLRFERRRPESLRFGD